MPAPTCRGRTRATCSAATSSPRRPVTPDEQDAQAQGDVLELPAASRATDIALNELELVYAFIYARVGNRADTEDLTQQVALKAIPRLRPGSAPEAIRAYLFATARSVLASFWAMRFGLPEEELRDDIWVERPRSQEAE